MHSETKILGGILLLFVVLITGAVIILSRSSSKVIVDDGVKGVNIDYEKGQKIGSSSANLKLVEFSDFQCPACKAAEPAIKEILATYPDQVQFIYRHFPLPQHKNAKAAAIIAEEAAKSGKFWQMHDLLFETQENWSNLADPIDYFADLAARLELDKEQVKKALLDRPYERKINEDIADGQNLGVTSTPTFFLNGKKLTLKSFNDLKTAVELQLK